MAPILPLAEIQRKAEGLYEYSLDQDNGIAGDEEEEGGMTPEGLESSDSSVSLDDLDGRSEAGSESSASCSTPGFRHLSMASSCGGES